MESSPPALTLLLLCLVKSTGYNLACVLTVLTLCAPPVSALSTSPTPDTSLTASIQPSFTTTPDPRATSLISSLGSERDNSSKDVNVVAVLPSSSAHLSEVASGVSQSDSLVTSFSSLSHQLSSSHGSMSASVIQTETLGGVLSTSVLLEPTYTSLQSAVVASSTILGSSYSPDTGGMNSSTSPVSSQRTTVSGNDTITKSTLDGAGAATSTTLSPPFGNGSCSGNNTGCPEYNGKQDITLSTPAIIGIAVGAAVLVIIVVCLLLCMCRRRRTLSGSKADLSTYWDDNVTLSYINGHLDYPKDVSDEMVSLDNDSFLNSLDSMSFSNVWATENAKHTNF